MSLVWGAVNAGIAANAIPQRGELRGTVRVLDRDAWKDAEDLMRSLVERVAATTGAEVRRRLRPRRAAGGQRPARGRAACGPPRWRPSAATSVVLTPQSMGGEDFGWFAEVMPIALARLGTHGGGPPLDLHRGTFDVDERAIGVGVRLMARTALHALEADAAAPAGRPPAAPAPGARRHFCPTSRRREAGTRR